VRNLSRSRQKSLANTNTVVEETLQNINTVKAFTNETFEYNRYKTEMGHVVKTSLQLAKYRAAFATFIIVVLFGSDLFILWYGAKMVQDHEMTIGQLGFVISYTAIIGAAIGSLGNSIRRLLLHWRNERIREILNEKVEVNVLWLSTGLR